MNQNSELLKIDYMGTKKIRRKKTEHRLFFYSLNRLKYLAKFYFLFSYVN